MSTVGDALTALKNVVLMQERLDVMRQELVDVKGAVGRVNDRVIDLDRRLLRIEIMVEMLRGGVAGRIEQ